MSTKIYKLAALFAMDHHDRGCGETDRIVRQTKLHWFVEMDASGYEDMLTDADYYHDMRHEMDGLEGICRSAKRVLDVLLKEGPPEGFVVQKRGYSYVVAPMEAAS